MNRLTLLFAGAMAVQPGPALAATFPSISTDFNFIGISGNDGELSSSINCTLDVCGVFDQLKFYQPHDGQVNLNWTRADGSVLLDGKVPWDFSLSGGLNTDIGRESSWTYKGFISGPPAFQQLQGTADFRGSITINPPCFSFVCKQDYLELFFTIPNVFGGSSSGNEQQSVHALAAAANPQLSITWRLSNLSVPNGSPFGTEPTADPVTEFSSTVEKLDTGFRYSYAITNFTNDPVNFSIDQLGWKGTLDAHGTLSQDILSSLAPGLVLNTGESDQGRGRDMQSSFYVLQPAATQATPEPGTWVLVGSGLAFTVLVMRRRRGTMY